MDRGGWPQDVTIQEIGETKKYGTIEFIWFFFKGEKGKNLTDKNHRTERQQNSQ